MFKVANNSGAMEAANHLKNSAMEAENHVKHGTSFNSEMNKMVCKIVISLCLISYTCVSLGQVVKVNNKSIYSQAISLAHVINLMHDGSSPLYAPLTRFDGEDFVSHRFSFMGYNSTSFGRTDTISFHFFNNFLRNQLAINVNGRDYTLDWINDRISGINMSSVRYEVEFDDQNRVIRLDRGFMRDASNNRNRTFYNFYYTEEGKISKVEKLYEITNNNGRLLHAGKGFTATYNYVNDQEIIVYSERYAETTSARTNIVNYAFTTHYRFSPGKLNIERQINIREENRRPTTVNDNNPTIIEHEFTQHNLTKLKAYAKQTPHLSNTSTFEYDNRGFCVRMEEVNILEERTFHSIYTYTYELKTGEDPNLEKSYTVSFLMQRLNANGEIYEEIRDNRIRTKDENGNWGEWRFVRI